MRILILDGGYQSISVSHSLKGLFDTILVSNDPIALKGRYFYKKISQYPSDKNQLYDFLKNVITDYDIGILIPMSDYMANFISLNKTKFEIETNALCAIPDYEIFQKGSNKSLLMDFCAKWNIPHPKTINLQEENYKIEDINFPALIKPNHSVGARGITFVNNIEDFRNKVGVIRKIYGECTLQEYIDNDKYYYNVMMYRDKNGNFHNTVITKILRFYPIKGGSSSYCYTIENQQIESICQNLLEKLNWYGFADFDVLEKSPNDYRIIEINPRVPASLGAAENSGVHFPQIMIADLLGHPIPKFKYITGRPLRFIGLDLAWFISSPNRFKCKPSWFNFFQKNIHFQEGGIREYKVMLYSFFYGLKKFLKKSKDNL